MFDPLFRFIGRPGRPAAAVKPRSAAPGVEALEDRWMPSVSPVTAASGAVANNLAAGQQATQEVDATFTPFKTGGSQTQTVAQFNSSLGQLTGVQIITQGTLTSDLRVENVDSAASNVTGQVSGTLALQAPGVSSPLTVTPTLNESTSLSAFDGTIDFGGTSGHDFGPQSAQATTSVTLSASNQDLSAWTGSGNVTLTDNAQSSSTVSGSGNLVSQVGTTAAGTVRVIYTYTPNAPTPPPPSNNTPPPTTTPPDNCGCGDSNSTPPATCASTGSLSGFVYVDANQTGHKTSGDAGVPGVTINLTGTTVGGQAVHQTTMTAADGSYSFTNLQPGIYQLSDVQPSGFQPGALNIGSLGGVVSGNQMVVAVAGGSVGQCYDFGEIMPTPPAPPPSSVSVTPPTNNTPPPATPPATPPPQSDPPPASQPADPVFSKWLLIGNNWQSLL